MMTVISQLGPKLIKYLLLILLFSCNEKGPDSIQRSLEGKISLPSGRVLNVKIIHSMRDQQVGLSGVTDDKFAENDAMLFFYMTDGPRNFWMPNTYFNLDIIFVDKDLKILYIAKNMKAHPGLEEPPIIARTETIYCRYVIEIKSSSNISNELKNGTQFKWISKPSLSEIESNIRVEK